MEFSSSKSTTWRKAKQPEAQFCMVCLNTSEDCKLYAANTHNLDMEFEHLTGISLQGNLNFEPQFCSECAQRLSNCVKFRDKSLRAYHLLLGLVELDKPFTIQNIKILSSSNNLTSSITEKTFQPDHCDLYLNHEERQEQAKLQQEIAMNRPIKVQPDLLNNRLINTHEQSPNNEPIKTQEDLLNNGAIKIELKLFDGKLMLNPIPELESKDEPTSLDEFHSDYDINIDDDNDNCSDIDTQCHKRIKDKVDKFMNDVMNDTDNDWDFLKDSDSDNDSVSAPKTDIKIEKERIHKPRPAPRKPQKVNEQIKDDKLEYLEYFEVTTLTHEEQLEDIQQRKEKPNYKNAVFKCKICFKGFLNDFAYKTHMDRHTEKYGKSVCPICGLHSRSDYAVRHHVINTHSTRYICLHCSFVTNHQQVAINHAKWHRGVTFTCPYCLEVHHSRSGHMSHLRIVHPTDTVCTQCGYSFINQRGLRTHISLKHHNEDMRNPDGPLCEECDIRFASSAAYQQHLEVSPKHAPDGQRRRNAPRHLQKPHAEKQRGPRAMVKCEQCGEQFKGFGVYHYHFQRKHPDAARTLYPKSRGTRCLCEQCGKSFKSQYALRDHKLTHTGKKQFQCDLCKKWFYVKGTLVLHIKTHSQQQPVFACNVCDKKFVNKANCNRHKWTHVERKPHQCHVCDKSFVNQSTLRTHVEHAHLKKPYPKKMRGPRQRASRARHSKDPVCGTIWPKDCVTADGQSAHTLDSRQLAAREPQRTLLDAQRV